MVGSDYLTPRSRSLYEKLTFTQIFMKFPSHYGILGFILPWLQVPAICISFHPHEPDVTLYPTLLRLTSLLRLFTFYRPRAKVLKIKSRYQI
jgi:hypothetical protein